MTSATERLQEILAKARPGPYIADLHNEVRDGGRYIVYIRAQNDAVPIAAVPAGVMDYGREEGRATAVLLAEAVNGLPGLLASLDEITRERDAAAKRAEEAERDAMTAAIVEARP